MTGFWGFVGGYWWLVFPLGGVVGGWFKGVAVYNEKRRKDKIEMLRIKHGAATAEVESRHATQSGIDRVLAAHDDVTRRWFEYETNLQTVIDFPMMTNVREPLTADFHRAKVVADNLRPDDPAELTDHPTFVEYRDAVNAYRVAFEIAEREAQRRRRSDYSPAEQDALARAGKLVAVADDGSATQAERQSAYRHARRELEGVLLVPERAAVQLERRIAGALETGH
ncbi:MAG: hypothetical protein WKF57_20190 [Nakamurella sp.]